jgi:hypothetical protein
MDVGKKRQEKSLLLCGNKQDTKKIPLVFYVALKVYTLPR